MEEEASLGLVVLVAWEASPLGVLLGGVEVSVAVGDSQGVEELHSQVQVEVVVGLEVEVVAVVVLEVEVVVVMVEHRLLVEVGTEVQWSADLRQEFRDRLWLR